MELLSLQRKNYFINMKVVKKIWGKEVWIINKDYCGKILYLNQGYRCSLHFHKKKDETFYVIRGEVLMELEKRKFIMRPGDSCHIKPGKLHRFTGLTDAQIIEFSTHHEDSDSYRKEKSGKAFLKEAYDYDGVISNKIEVKKGFPIITSRSFQELNKIPIKIRKEHPIYFNPIPINQKTLKKEIEWKNKMIKKLGIEVFYEDKPEVIAELRRLNPSCYIKKV